MHTTQYQDQFKQLLMLLQAGEKDADGIMDDFIKGVIVGTKELGSTILYQNLSGQRPY